MAEAVIDPLEVIEIDEGNSKAGVVTSCGVPLQFQDLLPAAAGKDAGERVSNGLAHQRDHEGQLAETRQ